MAISMTSRPSAAVPITVIPGSMLNSDAIPSLTSC